MKGKSKKSYKRKFTKKNKIKGGSNSPLINARQRLRSLQSNVRKIIVEHIEESNEKKNNNRRTTNFFQKWLEQSQALEEQLQSNTGLNTTSSHKKLSNNKFNENYKKFTETLQQMYNEEELEVSKKENAKRLLNNEKIKKKALKNLHLLNLNENNLNKIINQYVICYLCDKAIFGSISSYSIGNINICHNCYTQLKSQDTRFILNGLNPEQFMNDQLDGSVSS